MVIYVKHNNYYLFFRTPLHLACAQGHTQVVSELLEWKAKMFLGDSDGHTPLMKVIYFIIKTG